MTAIPTLTQLHWLCYRLHRREKSSRVCCGASAGDELHKNYLNRGGSVCGLPCDLRHAQYVWVRHCCESCVPDLCNSRLLLPQEEATKKAASMCKAAAAELEAARIEAETAQHAAVAEAEQRLQEKLQEMTHAKEAAEVESCMLIVKSLPIVLHFTMNRVLRTSISQNIIAFYAPVCAYDRAYMDPGKIGHRQSQQRRHATA